MSAPPEDPFADLFGEPEPARESEPGSAAPPTAPDRRTPARLSVATAPDSTGADGHQDRWWEREPPDEEPWPEDGLGAGHHDVPPADLAAGPATGPVTGPVASPATGTAGRSPASGSWDEVGRPRWFRRHRPETRRPDPATVPRNTAAADAAPTGHAGHAGDGDGGGWNGLSVSELARMDAEARRRRSSDLPNRMVREAQARARAAGHAPALTSRASEGPGARQMDG